MGEGKIGSMGLTHAYHHIQNNKDLYSTGNYIQYLIINYDGKEFEKYSYTHNQIALVCI